MRLRWISPSDEPGGASLHGYWAASTEDGGNDGAGPDPLTAVSELVVQIERERAAAVRHCPHWYVNWDTPCCRCGYNGADETACPGEPHDGRPPVAAQCTVG